MTGTGNKLMKRFPPKSQKRAQLLLPGHSARIHADIIGFTAFGATQSTVLKPSLLHEHSTPSSSRPSSLSRPSDAPIGSVTIRSAHCLKTRRQPCEEARFCQDEEILTPSGALQWTSWLLSMPYIKIIVLHRGWPYITTKMRRLFRRTAQHSARCSAAAQFATTTAPATWASPQQTA